MGRTVILVSDDGEFVQSMRAMAQAKGASVKTYTEAEWAANVSNPSFWQSFGGNLSAGTANMGGAKILPFPGTTEAGTGSGGVQTINEMESVAIENAIHKFNGNLTEAAKALGIGRATLYRKVKQYNIDPSAARKKRAA